MKTVYIDEYFILNLAVDYCILLASAKLCSRELKRGRFALSAALGALYACLALLPGFGALELVPCRIALGFSMSLTAFGKRSYFRMTAAFFAVSAAFGGAVFAVSMLAGVQDGEYSYVNLPFRVFALSFAAFYFVLTFVFRNMARHKKRETVKVEIIQNENKAVFTALRDTGNELSDPLSGLPVMVTDISALAPLFHIGADIALINGSAEFISAMDGSGINFRLVPYTTVGTGIQLLPVFRPDSITIDGTVRKDVLVGLTAHRLCQDGEYSAVI